MITTVAEANVAPASVATLPLIDEVVSLARVTVEDPTVNATARATGPSFLLNVLIMIFPFNECNTLNLTLIDFYTAILFFWGVYMSIVTDMFLA